jgi:hypothetical protein
VPREKEQRGKGRPCGRDAEAALHAGEEVGKRASGCGTLRRQGRPKVRCGEGQCLEWIGTTERVDRRIELDERIFF